MGSELQEFKLGERSSIKSSKRIFAREYVESGVPFWRSKDVIDKSFGVFSSFDLFITEERYLEISSKFGAPNKGDLLISSVGNRAGQPYIIQEEGDFYFKDGNILWFSEFNELNPRFLAYWLKSEIGQATLDSVMIGSAQKALTIDALRNLKVQFPEENYQNKADKILSAIDNKIQLNRQTNQTLEAMAQALFKSWFVDFDPVFDNIIAHNLAHNNAPLHNIPEPLLPHAQRRLNAQNVGRGSARQTASQEFHHLFPQVFEQSDEPSVGIQGWVPKGWGVSNVGNVSKCFDKKRIPLSKKQREEKKPGNIPYHGATSVMDHINEWIFDDVYLLIGEDGSVVKEDGSPFVQYIWGKSWVNNHAHVLQGDSGISTEHLMLFMQAQNIKAYITGAVQLKINQGNMNSIPFLKASGGVNATFSERIEIIYQKLRLLNDSNKSLIKLRDTLLPKLISGELRIPDAEQATEALAK